MTLRSVYLTALKLIGEVDYSMSESELSERAPYIGAALCREAAALDRAYRKAFGVGETQEFEGLYLDLEAEFPLLTALLPPPHTIWRQC